MSNASGGRHATFDLSNARSSSRKRAAHSGVTPNSAADNEAAVALLEAASGSTAPNSTSTSCGTGIPLEERIISQQAVPAGLDMPDSHSFSTASTLLTLATSPRATPPPGWFGPRSGDCSVLCVHRYARPRSYAERGCSAVSSSRPPAAAMCAHIAHSLVPLLRFF